MADASLKDDAARVRRMFGEALGRSPSECRIDGSLSFVKTIAGGGDVAQKELAAAEARGAGVAAARSTPFSAPARERLEQKAKARQGRPSPRRTLPEPFAEWDFKRGHEDLRGRLNLALQGDARIENGALVLDGGKSYAKSAALTKTLGEKTMEAWLMLSNLDQRGGGVMTLQDDQGERL